jgi:hypothetical protein
MLTNLLGGAYGLAMRRCFFEVADGLKTIDPETEIAYVIEDGAKGKGAGSQNIRSA